MTTLQKTMLNLAALLKETWTSTATGGSTTTLIDSACTEPNDWFNNGVIFFISGNNAGKSATITDYASSTTTFSFAAPGGGACAAGNRYTALRGYTREQLVSAINNALDDIGDCLQVDDSLEGIADTLAYDLPDGVSGVRRVESGEDRERNYYWQVAGGQLVFASGDEPAAGDTIYIWYVGHHATVSLDADVVSDFVDPAKIAWSAAYYALIARMHTLADADPRLENYVKMVQAKMLELQARKPNLIIGIDPRHGGYK